MFREGQPGPTATPTVVRTIARARARGEKLALSCPREDTGGAGGRRQRSEKEDLKEKMEETMEQEQGDLGSEVALALGMES